MSAHNPEIHIPGRWRCAKCGFGLSQMNMNAGDGTVTPRDEAGDKCPNDGSPLWRVTYREAYREYIELAEPDCEQVMLINALRSNKGCAVTIAHDNPANGPGSGITWVDATGRPRCYFGDTVLDALRLAYADWEKWHVSTVGQMRVALQEMPEYQQGWEAREAGKPKATGPLIGNPATAYKLGWEDCDDDAKPRCEP